jgi:hypothetical protein
MKDSEWTHEFRQLWNRAVRAWHDGHRSPDTLFNPQDTALLRSLGCSPQELFDCVDDHLTYAEPDFDTVLAITAIRRDYFLNVQQGRATGCVGSSGPLPPKDAEAEGIPWLPRILAKARLKLRGEMPPDLMYGCGGDRAFLAEVNLTAPAFLQLVRDHEHDDRPIIEAVKREATAPKLP